MLSILKKVLAVLSVLKSRTFAVAGLSLIMAFTVFRVTSMTRIVSIREGNDVQTCYTMNTDPREILAESGIVTMAYDAVDVSGFEGMLGEISIKRAFPVTVVVDKTRTEHMVTGGTVGELLEDAAIKLGEHDLVDEPLDELVEEDDVITVKRQEYVLRTEEEELPFETLTIPTSLLSPKKQKILVEGQTGLRVDTFSQMIIDGKAEEEYLLSQDIIKKPVNAEVLVGFASQPVSSFDFGYAFDENGEPIGYTNVLRGQRAAGYSARPGAGTASGRKAMVGNIAVNPNVIPYGSKLFIQSSDGKFVYGYAVAADTGTALKQGIVDVDLFYGSYQESALNGIKSVDIYIF